jgi:phosphatidylglycerol:prolipoprotein diacylglycerol transferase
MERWLTGVVRLAHESAPSVLWMGSLVVSLAYAVRSARRSGLDPRVAYWAGTLAIVVGLFGSRLLGMVVYASQGPVQLRDLIDGGRSYYGGLLGGAAAALLFLRLRGAPVLRHADALSPATALGYFIGRLGCFCNGDDYGVLARGAFAVRYPPSSEAFVAQVERGLISSTETLSLPVVPVQLLHSALGLALFFWLRAPDAVPGRRLGKLALAYGVGRLLIELVRGDFVPALGPLSLQQLISLGVVVAGVVLLWRARAAAPAAAAVASP